MAKKSDLDGAPMIVVKRAVHDERDGVARCASLLRRAIRTHDALPDRYRQRVWPDYLQSSADAYGYTDVRPPKFRPSPKDVSSVSATPTNMKKIARMHKISVLPVALALM